MCWPECKGQNSQVLLMMMKDMYGNYVIQKALEVAQGAHLKAILQQIKDNSAQLRKVRYGRHIVSYVEKMLDEQGQKRNNNHRKDKK